MYLSGMKRNLISDIFSTPWINLAILIFFFGSFFYTLFSLYKIANTIAPDFSVLWNAAKDLQASRNPYLNSELYTGVGYPPNTLLFYLPLTLLPYHTSQVIFLFLSLLALVGSVYLSLLLTFKKFNKLFFLFGSSLVLISFPWKFTLGMGQNNSISLLLILFSLYFYLSKRDNTSGFFLGLSIALKTIFGFFLLFFLTQRKWKLISIALIVIAFSIVLSIRLSGSETNLYTYYIREVIPPLLNYEGREIYYNQGILGFISRLYPDLNLRKILNGVVSLMLLILITLISQIKKDKVLLVFSFFVISLLLIDSLSWQHHFVWLVFPFTELIYETWKRRKYYLLYLIFVAYLLISWNFKSPGSYFDFPKIIILSNTFYGSLILLFINIYLLLVPKRINLFKKEFGDQGEKG